MIRKTGVQSQVESDLLNTQHFEVRIKGKVNRSREWIFALHFGVVAIEKEAFGSLSTKVATFNFFYH